MATLSTEVVRDALRDWTQKRHVRQQGREELRQARLEEPSLAQRAEALLRARP